MTRSFDILVIGAGPGGQIAATRAAQLGFKTACVDEWKNTVGGPAPGGTCTNVGCIPSKALLQSSEYYELAQRHFGDHGIGVQGLSIDIAKFQARKDSVVKKNNDGILYLFRKNNITFIHGRATFAAPPASAHDDYTLDIEGRDGKESVTARYVIVASGSRARPLPHAPFDEVQVMSNDGALRMATLPAKLGVIGAGVIGLELGSVWRRLGAEVTILESMPTFLGTVDEQVAREAKKSFERQGLKFEFGVSVTGVSVSPGGVRVEYTSSSGEGKVLLVDRLVGCIGRVPNTVGLGAEVVGLKLDDRGAIEVDDHCRTNLPNVWAIGDAVRGPMLAHKAEEEGSAVAERIAGQLPEVDFNTVPWVIYTSPEIAWVGESEQQLRDSGRTYLSGTFPFSANGRARAMGDTNGLVKVLADAQSDQILGVHIMGPHASELIAEAVAAMEFRASSEDIGRIIHPHPTLSEALKEASLAVHKRALNFA
jgi:dihydrolipoamide dehydrogenase